MSTEKSPPSSKAAVGAGVGAATVSPPKKKQQPSLYARKLLQKLSTLSPNASLESLQTIASWIVFNRKKCDGMGEGLVIAAEDASSSSSSSSSSSHSHLEEAAARLMLLFRVLHRVLCSDRPDDSNTEGGGGGDAEKWAKSSHLRCRLGEIAIPSLWTAMAGSFENMVNNNNDSNNGDNEKEEEEIHATRDRYRNEVEDALEEWRESDAFGGPTALEEYRRGWIRAGKEAKKRRVEAAVEEEEVDGGENTGGGGAEGSESTPSAAAATMTVDDGDEKSTSARGLPSSTASSVSNNPNESKESADIPISTEDDSRGKERESKKTKSAAVELPASSAVARSATDETARTTKRDSFAGAAAAIEVDFEGIEESTVEPARFLDACKDIATMQITRDLGSDASMNLSSALSGIPPEVEEACDAVLTRRKNGEADARDGGTVAELLPAGSSSLSSLSDELLDLDLKYARQSLRSYREAIIQQREARLRCLRLLLQSRCSFGAADAARAFCGGKRKNADDANNNNMDDVLEKLKKRKEILVDAMALEGLDVEEDEEEKRMERDEGSLKPLSWFLEAEGGNEGPEAKKQRSC